MAATAVSLVLLLAFAPAWMAELLEEAVIGARAYVCTRKAPAKTDGSFYLILQHDSKRRLIDLSLIHDGLTENAVLKNALTSGSTRGDNRAGAWRITAEGVSAGHRLALQLTQQWRGGEVDTDIDVTWDGRPYGTPCIPIRIPSTWE